MADIFVSYARAHLEQVRQLVEALRAENFDVWWDQDVPANAEWDLAIEAALHEAKAVIVCWSKASALSENVRGEARWARNQGRLLQAYLEPCNPPFFFGERQGADLSTWDGGRGAERFQFLVQGAHDLLAGKRPASGLGFRPKESRTAAFAFAGAGLLALAAVGILWIPELRERIFPAPRVEWTMNAGVGADFRPHLPPDARPIERLTSPLLIGMSPEFSSTGDADARAVVARERITLLIPDADPVEFGWLWFTDNDGDGAYIERTGNAAPFEIANTGDREIMFQPVSSYRWSNFVRDVHDGVAGGHQYMTLRIDSVVQVGEEERVLTATCSIPLLHVLLVIQDRRLDLQWISVPCGAPIPENALTPSLFDPTSWTAPP